MNLARLCFVILLTVASATTAGADYMAGWVALDGGDAEGARDAWIGGARSGDVDLQFNIGLLYESGLLDEIDHKAALEWYRAAAGRGLAAAQTRLARMLAAGEGVEADPDLATDLLMKAAQSGYAPAQYNLAIAYERAAGVPLDPDLAAAWYERAAAQGLPEAIYAMGRLAMNGGNASAAEAVGWYRAAAEAGLAEAANNLGLLYEQGKGVGRDVVAAATWYRRAADQGLAVAQNNLGQLLQYGEGLARDPVAAAVLYKQAAFGGNPFGQVNYAQALANGIGVEPDAVEAYAWLLLARVSGNPEAAGIASEYALRLQPRLDATMRHDAITRATNLRDQLGAALSLKQSQQLRPLPTEELGSPIVTAQRYLKVLGYLDGTIDGIAGPGTVAAVARFQRDTGLENNGRIDAVLVEALLAAAWADPAQAEEEPEQEEVTDAGN
jgi:uncharacterized protein